MIGENTTVRCASCGNDLEATPMLLGRRLVLNVKECEHCSLEKCRRTAKRSGARYERPTDAQC